MKQKIGLHGTVTVQRTPAAPCSHGARSNGGSPRRVSGQGPAARARPTAPARSRAARGEPGQPQSRPSGTSLGTGTGRDMGPWVGPAPWGPWPGRAGLGGAGERPCCGVAGAGADGQGVLGCGPGPVKAC